MPGSKSDHLENLFLDLLLGAVPAGFTRHRTLDTVQLALYTALPGDPGGGTEASGGGYQRVTLANNAANFPAAAAGVKCNGSEIVFPTFTSTVGTLRGWALLDGAGTPLYWGELAAADRQEYGANQQFVIPAGLLKIEED